MADQDVLDRDYSYPDNKYKNDLGVDDKTPSYFWAIPGHKGVAELFNWVARKIHEDLTKIVDWESTYGGRITLHPMDGLIPTSQREPDLVNIGGYLDAFQFGSNQVGEVKGSATLIRTEPSIILHWSMPDVDNNTDTNLEVDIDILGVGDQPGESIISSSVALTVPNSPDQKQETEIDLGDLSEGDEDDDGWDDVMGKQMEIFVKRDPDDAEIGAVHLHEVEVR